MGRFLCLLIILGILTSCNGGSRDEADLEAFIQSEVDKRVTEYKNTIYGQCLDRALEKAGLLADSILIVEARLERDTSGRPPKPVKPERPEIKTLIDTLPIKPFFRDTIKK